jgi:transmembrane sensor
MDYTNPDKINSLISSFLHGDITGEEGNQLVKWIQQSEENKVHFLLMKNLWDSSQPLKLSTEEALDKVLGQLEPIKQKVTFLQFWQKAAAVLLLPLIISTLWLGAGRLVNHQEVNSNPIKIVAQFGSFSSFELPDGSKVWLNAGSSIEYPRQFKKNNRLVQLTGEAYFEVRSNTASPFLVNTPYFSVKATGTRFNVAAYPKDPDPSVSLVEGKVSVSRKGWFGSQVAIASLKPNEHLVYNTLSGTSSISTEDNYKHIAWKDGKLVFRNDLLSDVAIKISRQYNVDIEIVGDSVKQYRFRASFKNEPLNELLRLLKISSPIDYREVEPKHLADGSFSRRKIIIFSAIN